MESTIKGLRLKEDSNLPNHQTDLCLRGLATPWMSHVHVIIKVKQMVSTSFSALLITSVTRHLICYKFFFNRIGYKD